jgi:hypothetical protein
MAISPFKPCRNDVILERMTEVTRILDAIEGGDTPKPSRSSYPATKVWIRTATLCHPSTATATSTKPAKGSCSITKRPARKKKPSNGGGSRPPVRSPDKTSYSPGLGRGNQGYVRGSK